MSRINGEKARAHLERRRRTARREQDRVLREEFLAKNSAPAGSKPVEAVKRTVKKAGEALAELAEMAKPKRKKKDEAAE